MKNRADKNHKVVNKTPPVQVNEAQTERHSSPEPWDRMDSQAINDPNWLSPDQYIAMQATLGNQELRRLLTLQRQTPVLDGTATAVLSPDQVTKARRFYAKRPHQYSKLIVEKIQTQVGSTVTGIVDDEMIQAVAAKQQANGGLEVDGMAGKNTILALFPNGLDNYDDNIILVSDAILLSDQQVAKALSFYASKPELYSAGIIEKIQQQVGAAPTGIMDAATVQAVARFQQFDGTLAVDGIAGPRTLPAVFQTGLAKSDEKLAYAKSAEGFDKVWDELGKEANPTQARADAIVAKVNERLKSSGVPDVVAKVNDKFASGSAVFQLKIWAIEVNKVDLEKSSNDVNIAAIFTIFYHEARHSEQLFATARLMLGRGVSANEVATRTTLPKHIVAKAAETPIIPGTVEAAVAQGWHDSYVGKDATQRNNTLEELDKATNADAKAKEDLDKAQKAFDSDPSAKNTAALDKAQKKFDKAHQRLLKADAKYRNLPEEADSYRVGGEVSKMLEAAP